MLKSDLTVAKNYLDEQQIRRLERAVTAYFDYIEMQIERHNTFTMEQFAASVDRFPCERAKISVNVRITLDKSHSGN